MAAFDLEDALRKSDSHSVSSTSDNQAAAPGSSDNDRRSISAKKRQRILTRDDYQCRNCKKNHSDDVELEVHHIVPKVMGGNDHDSNLATLCRPCHEAAHGWD